MAEKTFWQTIELTGDQLLKTVKELIEAGNVRRIRVRQKDRTVAEFPLTIGVVGAVFAPMLAAVGALAALLTECSIDVERVERPRPQRPQTPARQGKRHAESCKSGRGNPRRSRVLTLPKHQYLASCIHVESRHKLCFGLYSNAASVPRSSVCTSHNRSGSR